MSVVANVAINVDARGAAAQLRQFQNQSQAAQQAADNLAQKTDRVTNALRPLNTITTQVTRENRNLATSASNAALGIRQQAAEARQAASSISGLSGAVRDLGASLMAQVAAAVAFQQVVRTAADFETTLSDIGKTADTTDAKLASIADTLARMSAPTRTNLAPSVLAAGLQDLVAQGLELDAAVASLESLGKVAVATNSELTDVTKTGFQLQSALKIKPTELKATFDALAYAGKQGAFELKDMAQFMPTIASAATTLGITGKDGAIALAGMMQMVRKDAPGSAEAATRLTDALLKMTAPETTKNFKKFGVDIESVLKNAVKQGINPMDAAIKELIRVTGGDQFKLSQIFGDKEAKLAIQALMKYRQEYEQLKKEAGGGAAAGTVQRDFEKSLQTFNQQLATLQGAGERLGIALGGALLPVVSKLIGDLVGFANAVTAVVNAINQLPAPVKNGAAELIRLGVQVLLLDKAIKGVIALRAAFTAAMAGMGGSAAAAVVPTTAIGTAIKGAGTSAATATPLVAGLRAALQSLATLGIVTVGINLVVTGLQEFFAAQAEISKLRGERRAGGAAAIFGGSAPAETKEQARRDLVKIQAKQKELMSPGAIATRALLGPLAPLAGQPSGVADQMALLREREKRAQAIISLPTRTAAAAVTPTPAPTPAGAGVTPTKPGGKAGGGAKAATQAPENRTDALMSELRGLIAVGQAQDKIRDLQFQGRDILAAEVELEQELGQIERDRIEALKGANYTSEKIVINKIAEAKAVDARLKSEDRIRDITDQRFQSELQVQQAIRDTVKPFEDIRNAQAEQNQYQQTYLRLVMEGMLPAEAQRIANFDQMIRQQLEATERQIEITQGAILEAKARGANVVELQKELDLLKKKRDAIKGEAAAGPGQGPSNQDRLKGAIAEIKGQLNELTDPVNQIIAAANAIGDAFANSFKGLISGSMSAKEALRSFFEATASHFLDMAAQIIAKQIQMYILNTALSFLGGSMGGGGGGGAASSWGGSGFNPKAFQPGVKFMAEGGFVTSPTRAVVGEGGEPEYVIPASKMRTAMERYSSGARGASVLGGGGGTGGDTATSSGPIVVEVRASMERINSVDYVTAEQFQAGIQQAAQQGAAQGERRTLQRLQHSPATRRRVGVS